MRGDDSPVTSAPFPREIAWALSAALVLYAAALALVPELAADSFVARDPVTHAPFVLHRSHYTDVPFDLAWALVGLRAIPRAVRVAFLVIVVLLVAAPERLLERVQLSWRYEAPARVVRTATAAGLALGIAFVAMPVSYALNATFGDGTRIPPEVARGEVFAAEPLTTFAFVVARKLHALVSAPPNTVFAIRIVGALAGALFGGSVAVIAAHTSSSRALAVVLFAGVVVCGTTTMFFGYVETTAPAVAFIALYFAAALGAIHAMPTAASHAPLPHVALAVLAVALAILSHAACVLLAPSLVALLVVTDTEARGVWRLLSVRNAGVVTALLVVPCALGILFPFVVRGDLGNLAGGGDGVAWLPAHVDYAHRPSPWVYYARFSAWHLADLACAMIVAAPLAPLLLAAAVYAKLRHRVVFTPRARAAWWVASLAAAACLVVPLFWNHDFGMWGDWNLAATYLFALHVFAWIAFVTVTARFARPRTIYTRVFAPAILVQAMAAAGLFLQLV